MQIPKHLIICGHEYAIEEKSEAENGYPKCGDQDGWRNRIRLQKDMVQSKKESILMHEVVHEIDFLFGLSLSEETIGVLGETLYQILKVNRLKFY